MELGTETSPVSPLLKTTQVSLHLDSSQPRAVPQPGLSTPPSLGSSPSGLFSPLESDRPLHLPQWEGSSAHKAVTSPGAFPGQPLQASL